MGLFLLVQVPIMLVLSLFFALALDSGMMRLAKFVRLGIFVPYAVPSVIATLMWGYLYGPDFGPIAQIGEADRARRRRRSSPRPASSSRSSTS